ncbi:MAG: CCA tRNA nucleotidyltransferase [Proteobacteria bacterium]|nr:CCA tRNA nucleotidyltransferase [Pseudomonadota bacterium]
MRLEADWLASAPLRAVLDALDGPGNDTVFFVGGCVRNTLLGQPVADIDLTTPIEPGEVTRRLEAAGLKAVPTGIEHGTVMAVSGGEGFEITTFRADVATDGRRATVRFSTDIAVDAARRDFTMNAIYADPAGEIVDPLGGLPDLLARRIRFIGEPRDRIREDYLRIPRFFRFTAWYGEARHGNGGIEPEGLAACAELAEGIDGLARERIGAEMKKLLAAPDPAPAVAAMAACGVLARCLPGASAALLAPLVDLEGKAGVGADWMARLTALGAENPARTLRLSRAEAKGLAVIRALLAAPVPVAIAAHRHGARAAQAMALLRATKGDSGGDAGGLASLQTEIARGAGAEFPLLAADLIAAGIRPGPALGVALEAARTRWLDSDFALDKGELLAGALGEGFDPGAG